MKFTPSALPFHLTKDQIAVVTMAGSADAQVGEVGGQAACAVG